MNPIYIIIPVAFIAVIMIVTMIKGRKIANGTSTSDYTRKYNEALEEGALISAYGTSLELDGEVIPEDVKLMPPMSKYMDTSSFATFPVEAKEITISGIFATSSESLTGKTTVYTTNDRVTLTFTPELGKTYIVQMVTKLPKEGLVAQEEVSTTKFISALDKTLYIVAYEHTY